MSEQGFLQGIFINHVFLKGTSLLEKPGVYFRMNHQYKASHLALEGVKGAFLDPFEAFEFGVPLCLLIFLAAANMDPGKAGQPSTVCVFLWFFWWLRFVDQGTSSTVKGSCQGTRTHRGCLRFKHQEAKWSARCLEVGHDFKFGCIYPKMYRIQINIPTQPII